MGAILANLRIIALDTSGKAHQVAAVQREFRTHPRRGR